MKKKIDRKPIRLDFNVHTRQIEEVYAISPDGREVETDAGWVLNGREDVIVQRVINDTRYLSDKQIELLIQSDKEILADRKFRNTGAYIVAKAYPIKEWLCESL